MTAANEGAVWDVVVIGGGMGGAAAAHELCRLGASVLLLEKGKAEHSLSAPTVATRILEDPQQRLESGRWPTKVTARIDSRMSDIWPALGCGLGGSTLLYGAALSRLEPIDFASRQTPDGERIEWPFGYDELEPYYRRAEALLEVCGTVDPRDRTSCYELRDPPAMSDGDRHLFQALAAAGLQPYRLHVGIRYVPDCIECGGHICARRCKGDARSRFIEPALATGNLTVWDDTEVYELIADSRRVTGVRASRRGAEHRVEAKYVITAAGALFTPVLLQKSVNRDWPQGLGNQHGLVGRYLMFHASDFIAFWSRARHARNGATRTIAVRDFYAAGADKLGELQSTGIAAGYGEILYFLYEKFERSIFRRLPFLRPLLRIPAMIATRVFKEATVLATIVEDAPYRHNRVVADADGASGMRFEYAVPDELKGRVKRFRRLIKARMRGYWVVPLNHDVELNLGHPCGTCRAGVDPATSVVDPSCKVHGVDNLYVADASFMPTSGGTNPSLTVAGNALRVAGIIAERLAKPAEHAAPRAVAPLERAR